jgi:hypothetical protein
MSGLYRRQGGGFTHKAIHFYQPSTYPAWPTRINSQSRFMQATEGNEQRLHGLLSFAQVKRLLVDAA